MVEPRKNTYMEKALQEQAAVEYELHKRRAPAMPSPSLSAIQALDDFDSGTNTPSGPRSGGSDEHIQSYRITGFGPWRTVIVPPNAYVVHTRRGHADPVHMGLGISFPYRPYSDAFLIIPAAVQTLLINANCICRERQGILVQAYVQWIIGDLATAYRKLDFSDPHDPMGIVNVQLREQAEAAIKDKVATLSVDEVLSDKQPIIEELTHRLSAIAQGDREASQGHDNGTGLGLKIVTVQIKEAIVSSTRLWENLQAPFRAEREQIARLAELESQRAIAAHKLANREKREGEELAVAGRLSACRATEEREQYDRQQGETARRLQVEQESARRAITERNATAQARSEADLALVLQALEQEKQRLAAEADKLAQQTALEKAQAQANQAQVRAELDIINMKHQSKIAHEEQQLRLQEIQRAIDNDLSEAQLQAKLIQQLSAIAEHMPVPDEQRTTIITNDAPDSTFGPLVQFIASALAMLQDAGFKRQD